jgi:hypothetical protein
VTRIFGLQDHQPLPGAASLRTAKAVKKAALESSVYLSACDAQDDAAMVHAVGNTGQQGSAHVRAQILRRMAAARSIVGDAV